jgi:hypothetical protein
MHKSKLLQNVGCFFLLFFASFLAFSAKNVQQENWLFAGIGNHTWLLEVIFEAAPKQAAAGQVFDLLACQDITHIQKNIGRC